MIAVNLLHNRCSGCIYKNDDSCEVSFNYSYCHTTRRQILEHSNLYDKWRLFYDVLIFGLQDVFIFVVFVCSLSLHGEDYEHY
jgi:hypothetical protein